MVFKGAVEFLSSDYFYGKHAMPYSVTLDESESIPNKPRESGDWRKKVFGIKSVQKYNTHSCFLQLIGSGLGTYK